MRLVCLSDTHGFHESLMVPSGDVLVYAGDYAVKGTIEEAQRFDRWLGRQQHRHRVIVLGNHDGNRRFHNAEVLRLSSDGITIDGLRFWGGGTPTRPPPKGIDVLVHHSPPSSLLLKGHWPFLLIYGHAGAKQRYGYIRDSLGYCRTRFIRASLTRTVRGRRRVILPPLIVDLKQGESSIVVDGQELKHPGLIGTDHWELRRDVSSVYGTVHARVSSTLVTWLPRPRRILTELLEFDASMRRSLQATDDPRLGASADYRKQVDRYGAINPRSFDKLVRRLSQSEFDRMQKHPFYHAVRMYIPRESSYRCVELSIYDWIDPAMPPDDIDWFTSYSPPSFFYGVNISASRPSNP